MDRSAGCNTGDGLVPASGFLLLKSVINMLMVLDGFFENCENGRDMEQLRKLEMCKYLQPSILNWRCLPGSGT